LLPIKIVFNIVVLFAKGMGAVYLQYFIYKIGFPDFSGLII